MGPGEGGLLLGTDDADDGAAEMLEPLTHDEANAASGGIAATVVNIGESFITVEVADGVQLRVQKGAIANVLPKGTLKSA